MPMEDGARLGWIGLGWVGAGSLGLGIFLVAVSNLDPLQGHQGLVSHGKSIQLRHLSLTPYSSNKYSRGGIIIIILRTS